MTHCTMERGVIQVVGGSVVLTGLGNVHRVSFILPGTLACGGGLNLRPRIGAEREGPHFGLKGDILQDLVGIVGQAVAEAL